MTLKIHNTFSIVLFILILCTLPLFAEEYELKSDEVSKIHTGEMHVGAGVSFEPRKWVDIKISEQARFSTSGIIKSYTRAEFNFHTCNYFSLGADYTLIYTHKPDKDFLKHRIGASAMLVFHPGRWRIWLRERPLMTMRFDSINSAEKNKFDWKLRSKVGVQYNVPGKPLKPYLTFELENTLNAKSITGYFINEYTGTKSTYNFKGNYISMLRPTIGIKYTPAKHHHLNFYYRFSAEFNRDYNITHNSGKLEVTRERELTHTIGISYFFVVKK